MPKINKTKYALLGVLSQKSRSGYDIKKFCDSSISFFWTENYGHIYPVLKQMEKSGLVIKETVHTDGRPPRNVYSITDKGKAELNDWLLLPEEPHTLRFELLLKLFFSRDIPAGALIEKLEKQKESDQQTLEYIEKIEKILQTKPMEQKELRRWRATLSFGKLTALKTIAWCEETIKTLQEEIV